MHAEDHNLTVSQRYLNERTKVTWTYHSLVYIAFPTNKNSYCLETKKPNYKNTWKPFVRASTGEIIKVYVNNYDNLCQETYRRQWLHAITQQKDTKAAICDLQIPQVNAQVICRQVCLTITVD